ncbi:hypothetical protein NRT42_001614 [Klebsiella pneumoniae]|uniref:hypothetical protein n=1 Tax=Klebsiella pneumoniae complex TaxID=3390273 RepID=UPI000AE636A4|nr:MULTISPECIES: hypothetical protein [Klebsiella]EJG9787289.1 hypothetical protein [Klebsiella pneumoniae]EKU6508271.1 hypothetical protein [Klebsiella pneumoniae]ROF45402.1 hypothetical protein C4Y74_028415 [Klebsiella pneumoniae subsp. pneumoniae]SVX48257.1 Uncharacterised protein [Klebsiella pneumoniae]HBR1553275.1 hypothetical protein [Klebsiella pneumoniae]
MNTSGASVAHLTSNNSSKSISELVAALEQTNLYSYISQIATVYGFPPVKGGMDASLAAIEASIQNPTAAFPNATVSSLEKMIDRVIISGSNYYSIDETIDPNFQPFVHKIFKSSVPESQYESLYPKRLYDGNSLGKNIKGFYLTKLLDTGDGLAFIYSYIYSVKIKGSRGLGLSYTPQQHFVTAFVPNNKNRVEYRIPKLLGKREAAKALLALRNEFYDLFVKNNYNVVFQSLNFYNAITNIIADKQFGRAVQIIYVGSNTGSDANVIGRKDPTYEARDVEIKNTKRNDIYSPRSVAVRFYRNNGDFTELGLDPNKKSWLDDSFCGEFYIDFPEDTLSLNGLIENVISRK